MCPARIIISIFRVGEMQAKTDCRQQPGSDAEQLAKTIHHNLQCILLIQRRHSHRRHQHDHHAF